MCCWVLPGAASPLPAPQLLPVPCLGWGCSLLAPAGGSGAAGSLPALPGVGPLGGGVRVWPGARGSLGSSRGRGPRGSLWGRRAGKGQPVIGGGAAGAVAHPRGAWLASREAAIGAVLGRLPTPSPGERRNWPRSITGGREPDVRVEGGKEVRVSDWLSIRGAWRGRSGPRAIGGEAAVGGARGAAGRGLAAAAGARPAGAPWCGRERSMGRRLLRALLCLLLLAGRGLLRDGGASATATAAHGETGAPGRAAPRAARGPGPGRALPGERQGKGAPRPVLSLLPWMLVTVRGRGPGSRWKGGRR